jgi:hypothetical protein
MGEPIAELLTEAIAQTLPDREARIVRLRHGLDGNGQRTLREIGGDLRLSRERIRQLQKRALQRIKTTGTRRRTAGASDDPCAALITLAISLAAPDRPDWQQVTVGYVASEASRLPLRPTAVLLAYLGGRSYDDAQTAVDAYLRAFNAEQRHQQQLASRRARQEHARASFRTLLLGGAHWPQTPKVTSLRTRPTRSRDVAPREDGAVLTWFSDKLGREIPCESHNEWRFYAALDGLDEIVWYQEQPQRIAYHLDGQTSYYHPDVLIALRDGRRILAEIKDPYDMLLFVNLAKWLGLTQFCSRTGFGMFIGSERTSLPRMLTREVPATFEAAVLDAVDRDPLCWRDCLRLQEQHQALRLDLVTIVLRHGLVVRLDPYRLRRPTAAEAVVLTQLRTAITTGPHRGDAQ